MELHLSCLDFIKAVDQHRLSLRKAQNYLAYKMIEEELVRCHGNQSEAARKLGINRLTLRKLRENFDDPAKQ